MTLIHFCHTSHELQELQLEEGDEIVQLDGAIEVRQKHVMVFFDGAADCVDVKKEDVLPMPRNAPEKHLHEASEIVDEIAAYVGTDFKSPFFLDRAASGLRANNMRPGSLVYTCLQPDGTKGTNWYVGTIGDFPNADWASHENNSAERNCFFAPMVKLSKGNLHFLEEFVRTLVLPLFRDTSRFFRVDQFRRRGTLQSSWVTKNMCTSRIDCQFSR